MAGIAHGSPAERQSRRSADVGMCPPPARNDRGWMPACHPGREVVNGIFYNIVGLLRRCGGDALAAYLLFLGGPKDQ